MANLKSTQQFRGRKKIFSTVAKITRSDQIIRDLLSRLWRGKLALRLR
jgi:hypothetical protein